MPIQFTTEVGETREDAWENKGSRSSKKQSKVKDQQSENCTSDPKGGHKNKMNQEELHKNLEEWVKKHQKMEKTQQKMEQAR